MKKNLIRIILIGFFVLLAAAVCLALGLWQWDKYSSKNGTFQNLGYAAQWPVFAVCFIYFYYKFFKLEKNHKQIENKELPKKIQTEIPENFLINKAYNESKNKHQTKNNNLKE